MKRLTITLAVGALLLLLCSNCSFMDKMYAAQKIDQAATPVPFTTLENYFVRNDVDCSKQQRLIIDNKADFERFFGMAAHMGGMPTEVNWNKQFVHARDKSRDVHLPCCCQDNRQQLPGIQLPGEKGRQVIPHDGTLHRCGRQQAGNQTRNANLLP